MNQTKIQQSVVGVSYFWHTLLLESTPHLCWKDGETWTNDTFVLEVQGEQTQGPTFLDPTCS